MPDETVWEGSKYGTPYRVIKTETVDDEGVLYRAQYQQRPVENFWGERLRIHERDGLFYAYRRDFPDLSGLMAWGFVNQAL